MLLTMIFWTFVKLKFKKLLQKDYHLIFNVQLETFIEIKSILLKYQTLDITITNANG